MEKIYPEILLVRMKREHKDFIRKIARKNKSTEAQAVRNAIEIVMHGVELNKIARQHYEKHNR